MLNSSLSIDKSGNAASKGSNDWCPSKLPAIDLAGDRKIVNGEYLLIDTTYKSMSVPSTGLGLQSYSAKNNPCDHW